MRFPVGPVLDAHQAAALIDQIEACAAPAAILCIDLSDVEQYTADGIAGLRRCREAAGLAGAEVSYRASSRVGWQALVAALSDLPAPAPPMRA